MIVEFAMMRRVVKSVYGRISLIVCNLLWILDVSVLICLSCDSCCVIHIGAGRAVFPFCKILRS